MNDPQAISNPFYKAGPAWARWPLIILATIATSKFLIMKYSFLYSIDAVSYCFSINYYRCFFVNKSSIVSWLFTTITCYTYK